MEEQYGADFITITDEEGKEFELEILSSVEYNGAMYLALLPADVDDDSEQLEVSILKQVTEDGEDILVTVDDDDELEAVYALLLDDISDDEAE
ncbi:MAG: DUF1292 domain-containing protein [Oscillospiraceae bacterium]|nr:DUF1292 domain-containing protein [Oscillospiraceae bacterium]